jgi:hypothetical protein
MFVVGTSSTFMTRGLTARGQEARLGAGLAVDRDQPPRGQRGAVAPDDQARVILVDDHHPQPGHEQREGPQRRHHPTSMSQ